MARFIALPGLLLCYGVFSCAPSTTAHPFGVAPADAPGAEAKGSPLATRATIDEAIARHTLAFVRRQPQLSTSLELDETAAGGPYNHRLPDYSPRAMRELQAEMARGVTELASLDAAGLGPDDAMHLTVVRLIEAYYAGSTRFRGGYIDTWGGHLPYVVNQIRGPLIEIPEIMQAQQRVASIADAEAYIARLAAFPALVEGIEAKVEADEGEGSVLPKKLFPKTLAFLDRFVEPAPHEHPLVLALAGKLERIEGLVPQERARLVHAASAAIADHVYPSYRHVRQFMAEQQARAPEADGIWGQRGGDAFYLHELAFLADTALSAGDIHRLGRAEVARISAEMDAILSANGRTAGSVGERMTALGKDERFLYPESDAGRDALLADLNAQIRTILERAPSLFATLPKAGVEVRRISAATEASAPGGYYSPPSLGGGRPGVFWINLRDMHATPKFGLKTLTYHEAVPGHHFQIALNMERPEIGLFRQQATFNAYTEGWALYAELVAKEMGMYKGDPWGDLGRLQAELLRSVRLVVDTGLHAERWTREEAIAYFGDATGAPEREVVAEVERYMAWPGQALGYKLGMIELLRLREHARSQLGGTFDIRGFHDVILLPGARPMSVVRDDVERWLAVSAGVERGGERPGPYFKLFGSCELFERFESQLSLVLDRRAMEAYRPCGKRFRCVAQ